MRNYCWGFVLVFAFAAPGFAAQADYKGKTTLDGVFTAAQAARGAEAVETRCARCHGADLNGGNNSPLKGSQFIEKWREDKLDLLFGTIKSIMPRNAPGSLSDAMYADILTYILQQNGMPEGAQELTTTAMPAIQFVGAAGPKAAPNLSMVQVIGCLTAGPNDVLNLTNGTEPIRARRPEESTVEDAKSLGGASPRARTFRLNTDNPLAPFDFSAHIGHTVYLKGVINRTGNAERINVASALMLSEDCGK
jgi:S-disulfanyl-L-cysteine oxidoreductase SoxD